MSIDTRTVDTAAIGISGLCLLHCLALPILAAVSPLAGLVAEAEWVHRVFVVMAVPISAVAILRHYATKGGAVFPFLAITGLLLLCAAAFVEPLHDFETPLTVLGAVILAFSHLWRWAHHTHHGQ